MISRETKEEIRSRIDIVDLIGSYVALKRAGGRYKGLCPFHKEKTPSFHVQPERQMYYCFGCGKGGDIYSFLMDHDGMDFNTAIRMLADKAGVVIEEERNRGPKDGPDKRELFQTMEKCTNFFQHLLETAPEAQVARDYLDQRHLDSSVIKNWKVGFAPPAYHALRNWAKKEKIPEKHLHLTGMLATSDRGGSDPVYERFRGRLLFPIQDEMIRTVGFSGRVLDPEAKGAKYVNTPETVLFRKSKILYGFGHARKSIHDREFALLCEGQIDVIRCHSAGFSQAVAPQGTALTEEHVHILKRHTERVVLTFDSDSAGIKAAIRSSELLLAAEMTADIIQLPDGEDPDTLIQQYGPDALDECIHHAEPAILFYARKFREADHLDNPAHRAQTIRRLLEFINRSPSAVQKEQMVQQLSDFVGMSVAALQTDLNRQGNKRFTRLKEQPEAHIEEEDRSPEPPAEERELTGLLLDAPNLAEMVFSYLQPEHLSHPVCRKIYEIALSEPELNPDAMLQLAGGDGTATRLIAHLRMDSKNQSFGDFTPEDAAKELILRIRMKEIERRRNTYRKRITSPDEPDAETLRIECKQLTLDLGVLRKGWASAEPLLSWKEDNPAKNARLQ